MQVQEIQLKPLSSIELKPEDNAILKWFRSAAWEKVVGPNGSVLYKAKVPEFFGGAKLYRMQAGGASAGSLGALELFLKRLSLQGVITKQALYPLEGHGTAPRHLTLKKADLDNLGVGKEEEEE